MRVKEGIRKFLSILLCLCMLAQNCPVLAFAAETDNLCEHHTEHTADCGYAEGTSGSDCTHEHSEDCYVLVKCVHGCDGDCNQGCTHECTLESGCVTMSRDCHHVHGECSYSEGADCGHEHGDACGYAEPSDCSHSCEGVCPLMEDGMTYDCLHEEHDEDCGYSEGADCGHTVCDETCGYAEPVDCDHVCEVVVDSDDSCYELLCSHAQENQHDNVCGYIKAVQAQKCHYECTECADSEPPMDGVKCNCGTDDALIHAVSCAVYVAPENPVCYCTEKCTEANEWCDVCGFDYTKCGGEDTSAAYVEHSWEAGAPTAESVIVKYNDTTSVLTVSGTGAMEDFTNQRTPQWKTIIGKVTKIVIEPGVTTIGSWAFTRANNLTSVTIPNTVTTIGDNAFLASGPNASKLTSIAIPSSVTKIGDVAFSGAALTEVTIPDSVTYLGGNAFSNCSGLTSVTLPTSGLTEIRPGTFRNCTSLTEITIPANITSIGDQAFMNCSKLETVNYLGTTEPTFGSSGVFNGIPAATYATVPDGYSSTTFGTLAAKVPTPSGGTKYAVTAPDHDLGTFTLFTETAAAGETVTVNVVSNPGYKITDFTVTLDGTVNTVTAQRTSYSTSQTLDGVTVAEYDTATYQFEMPAGAVTLNAAYTGRTYNISYYTWGGDFKYPTEDWPKTYQYGVGVTLPDGSVVGERESTNDRYEDYVYVGWHQPNVTPKKQFTELTAEDFGDKTIAPLLHKHVFTCNADGQTIVVSCTSKNTHWDIYELEEDCPAGGTVTIAAPASIKYTGNAIEAAVDNEQTWLEIEVVYTAAEGSSLTDGKPVLPGSYIASIKLNEAVISTEYSIICDHTANENKDDGDCTTKLTCSVCDAVITEAQNAHSYGTNAQCTNEGCTVKPQVTVGGVALSIGEYLAVDGTEGTMEKPQGGYAHLYYDGEQLVLELSNYDNKGAYKGDSGYSAAIWSDYALTLELNGENTITNTAYSGDGIYAGDNLTMTGDGTLNLEASATGIYCENGYPNTATVTITGGRYCLDVGSYGIWTGTIRSTAGEIDCTSKAIASNILKAKIQDADGNDHAGYLKVKDYTVMLTNCDHVFSQKWEKDETHHWHACTVSGCATTKYPEVYNQLEDAEYAEHSYDEATQRCVCGATICDHSGNENKHSDCTVDFVCSVCKAVITEAKDDHDYVNHFCSVCNMEEPAYFTTYSITLKGNIGMNFYAKISDAVLKDEEAYVRITYADTTTEDLPLSEATANSNGYKFTARVAAKEMTDAIKAQIFYTGGESQQISCTIKGYADYTIENSSNTSLKNLVSAMLVYGAAAQMEFEYNTDNLAATIPDLSHVTADTLKNYMVTTGQGTELVSFNAPSLLLRSETTLRFYFRANSDFTAAYNGQDMTIKQIGTFRCVDVANISAKNLDDTFTITIDDGTDTAEVSCSPLGYCYLALQNENDAELCNAVRALYLYNQAANAYFS